ncbi:MAG: bifunctional precorrin-2 dehydrogenase/sirohydrochlorin ferrochelatase [Thermodesulfobacteria bacterium]|nr:bifunctional precorrin-2 dehydrogenase/sirohydrochlorin ferrochelatase [Thermodesulfobacteriota bacterium]
MAPMTSFENSHYVPIFCNLQGKKVVVVGGGRVAERKVRALLPSGAKIVVISPQVTQGLQEIIAQGEATHVSRGFSPGDLDGAWLVIAATDDTEVQDKVFKESEAMRCFCNVVDEPEKCSFIVPSVVKRGALSIAISTGGQSPGLARHLRMRLQEEFGEEWALYTELIGRLRRLILAGKCGKDMNERLERLINPDCLQWIREKEWDKLSKWAIDICGQHGKDVVKDVIS